MGARPLSWAAMLVSERTRTFYGRMESAQRADVEAANRRYMWGLWGSFRALSEAHLPVNLLRDEDLTQEQLHPYRLLLLDNAACLTPTAMEAIRAFVRAGGGLVATYETSLCSPEGEKLSDFGLPDLLGTRYEGDLKLNGGLTATENRGPIFLGDHAITNDPEIRRFAYRPIYYSAGDRRTQKAFDSLPFAGGALRVKPLDPATEIATIGMDERAPAILAHKYGKGRVVYIPLNLGQSYFFYSYPHLRMLLSRAVQWAAGTPPPIRVQGPSILRSTFFEQNDAGRWVVHLLNDMSSLGRISPGFSLTEYVSVMPIREEVIPLHDIVVTFQDPSIHRAHLEPEGKDLPLQRHSGLTSVTVPVLDLHSMVVAERRG
jgi:hypothetical protein